jgi:crotonobetainyl-CoA:carnitine CoA-transferase CaiB-like acyl-CoA transferase
MLNSNKRAITLNLKDERGKHLLFRMAEKADILLENFAPGVMDRLGVGFKVLHKINPRLVYASGSGYGLSGPDRDNLAMDLTIQAVSGLISVTGEPDRPPLKSGPAVVDFLSGIHLYAAAITALYERSVTGIGRLVEVAMQEAAYPTLTSQLEAYWRTGEVPPRQSQPGADQRLPGEGRLRCDEPRGRGALAQSAGGNGPRGLARRPALFLAAGAGRAP